MNELIKAIEEAKTDTSNFSMMFCGMTGRISLAFFKIGKLIESEEFKRGEIQQAIDWIATRQPNTTATTVADYVKALENGGRLNGKPEREWLADMIVDFEDWLLADSAKTRRLLLHMFNSEHHADMVDRIQNLIDYEINRHG